MCSACMIRSSAHILLESALLTQERTFEFGPTIDFGPNFKPTFDFRPTLGPIFYF